jgi:drug/metabolite transporter (DMT)-like permease
VIGLLAMGCVALRDLSTRSLSSGVPSLAVTIYAALAVTLLGAVLAPFQGWVAVTLPQFLSLVGAAVFLIGGYQFIIMAMRVGEVSAVTPFRYPSLLFAVLLGWVPFGQLPEAMTLLGAGIVIASGLFMLRRERQLGIT